MGHGWDTDIRGFLLRAPKQATLQADKGKEGSGKEDKCGEVEEGDGGLGFSTSLGGALVDGVIVQVLLVGTRSGLDVGGNGGGSSKGEDKVQDVKGSENDRPGQGLDKEGKGAVDGGGKDGPGSSKNSKVDLGVGLGVGGGSQGPGQGQGDDQEE